MTKLSSFQFIGRKVIQDGYVVPAHHEGTHFEGQKISTQLRRRCYDMEEWGILSRAEKEGRCEKWILNPKLKEWMRLNGRTTFFVNQDYTEILNHPTPSESREESRQIALI